MTAFAITSAPSLRGGPPADWTVRRSWALGAFVAAVMLGMATPWSPFLGVAAAGGLVLMVVAARDLQLAMALWIPTLFLEGLPSFNAAGKAGGLVILVAWLLQLGRKGLGLRDLLSRSFWVTVLLLVLMTWMTATVLWATDWHLAASGLLRWYAVGVLFVVVASTVRDLAAVRLVCLAFVVGGVLSVVVSLAGGGAVGAGVPASRLGGAAGDPNFLGAWLLSSMLLGMGLVALTRRTSVRVVLAGTLLLLAVGMGLTLSRGAFVAAGVTCIAALILLQGRRLYVLCATVLGTSGLALWLASSPTAWDRFSHSEGGSGRTDLWTIAWRMARDNPLTGVGLDNFTVKADVYMRQIGPIHSTYLISRALPDQVHNVYLQMLAEGGPLALLLISAFALGCLRATVRAARRLDRAGERAGASLAYGVLLAQCSLLAAAMFLSSAVDKRLWLLLALGPALAAASRSAAGDHR